MKKIIFVVLILSLFMSNIFAADDQLTSENFHLSNKEKAFIDNMPQLRIMADDSFTPLSSYDKADKKYYGASVELFEKAADIIGLKYTLVYDGSITWSDKVRLVRDKEIDVLFPVSITGIRKEIGIFSQPYYSMYYSVISLRENAAAINGIQELADKKIGLVEAASISDFIKDKVDSGNITYYKSDKSMYQGLMNKEIDFGFQNENVFIEDFYKYELFDIDKIYRIVEFPREYCFFFRQGEDMEALAEIINRAVNYFDMSQLIDKYGYGELTLVSKYMRQKRDRDMILMALIGVTVILLFLTIIYIRNKNLSERLKTQATINEMAYLQSQIRPHFLFNALSAIIAFCYTDPEKAGDLLNSLSRYLRIIFNTENTNELVTVEREMELIRSYVNIEQARYGERLKIYFQISDECLDCKIMPLMIQPLVENSIRHNISEKEEGVELGLTISETDGELVIIVEDNGVGIPKEKILNMDSGQVGAGIGLANINERLRHYRNGEMFIESSECRGTKIILFFPAMR